MNTRQRTSDGGKLGFDLDELEFDNQPTHRLIADALRRRIAFGVYAPGQRLPSERELAHALGVGRMTVRSAVRILAQDGLLETKRGRLGGTFVAEREPARRQGTRSGRTKDKIQESAREVRQTYEFRLLLEPQVARLCAERASAPERTAIVDLAREDAGSVAHYRALDSRFHLAIARACGNRMAFEALKRARAEFFTWADAFFDIEWKPQLVWSRESEAEHRAIANAIAKGQGEHAAGLMTGHLMAALQIYEEIVVIGRLPSPR